MLSYQHIYHAGNAADVHKHLWLIAVLQTLLQKNTPVCWIDTHAGRGQYDLKAPEAQKIAEYKTGFEPVYAALSGTPELPPPLRTYFRIVRELNPAGPITTLPGSALMAAKLLRPQDRLLAFDKHRGEYPHLAETLTPYKNSRTRQADGLGHMLKYLPPKEKIGGVLIDPSYEVKTEYTLIADTLRSAFKLWPAGIFMIWYPILRAGHHSAMTDAIKSCAPNTLIDEWVWRDPAAEGRGMLGSGMAVVNAPPNAAKALRPIKDKLMPCFA